ncbi:MAG: hypothetical protein ACI4F9_07735 [Lachnospiraceae bacterium]
MAKIKEYERGRLSGLNMALRIVKQYGVDNLEQGVKELERECKARGAYNIHSPYTYNELVAISEEITLGLKKRILDTNLAMTMHVLQDEFGFGKVRLERFMKRYVEKNGMYA